MSDEFGSLSLGNFRTHQEHFDTSSVFIAWFPSKCVDMLGGPLTQYCRFAVRRELAPTESWAEHYQYRLNIFTFQRFKIKKAEEIGGQLQPTSPCNYISSECAITRAFQPRLCEKKLRNKLMAIKGVYKVLFKQSEGKRIKTKEF